MKKYLKAIRLHEAQIGMFDLLVTYFLEKKSTLSNELCEGGYYLPSFILLKKLKEKYANLCECDEELSNLFDSAIECSKLFYLKTVSIMRKNRDDKDKYEANFESISQPLGQQLVNLLANIKYRIKIVRLKNTRKEIENKKYIPYYLFYYFHSVLGFTNNVIYKATLAASSNHSLVRKMYFGGIFGTILAFWLMNFVFLNNISPISSAFINVLAGIGVVVLAIATYPIGDFGKKDISGRNIVAYKYKVLLNNKGNNKLINIFKLQQGRTVTSRAT